MPRISCGKKSEGKEAGKDRCQGSKRVLGEKKWRDWDSKQKSWGKDAISWFCVWYQGVGDVFKMTFTSENFETPLKTFFTPGRFLASGVLVVFCCWVLSFQFVVTTSRDLLSCLSSCFITRMKNAQLAMTKGKSVQAFMGGLILQDSTATFFPSDTWPDQWVSHMLRELAKLSAVKTRAHQRKVVALWSYGSGEDTWSPWTSVHSSVKWEWS